MTDDLRRLVDAYATGTLTEEERELLMRAALDDQEVFDALYSEQPLKDAIEDPQLRAELVRALEPDRSLAGTFWSWLRRPVSMGLVTAGTVALVLISVRATRDAEAPQSQTAESRESVKLSVPRLPEARTVGPEQKVIMQPEATQARAQAPRREQPSKPAFADGLAEQNSTRSAGVVGGVSGTASGVGFGTGGGVSPPPSAPAAEALVVQTAPVEKASSAKPLLYTATSGAVTLQYGLLSRAGQYVAAASTAIFQSKEGVRVAVEVTEPGTLVISQDSRNIYSGPIAANVRLLAPANDWIVAEAASRLRIMFQRTQAGVVANFVARRKTAAAAAEPSKDEARQDAAAAPPPQPETVTVELTIRPN